MNTDTSAASEEVGRSPALLQIAASLAKFGAWELDVETGALSLSDEAASLWRSADGPPKNLTDVIDVLSQRDRERWRAAIEACIGSGIAFDLDIEVITTTGEAISARSLAAPIVDEMGTVVRVVGAVHDVTERVRADRLAREAAAALVDSSECLPAALLSLDHDWRYTSVNRRAEEMSGHSRSTLLGCVAWEVPPPDLVQPFHDVLRETMATGVSAMAEGYVAPIDTWIELYAYKTAEGLSVCLRDVGEQRRGRLELEERNKRPMFQDRLLDLAHDAILIRDDRSIITYWNAGAERLYGWSRDEAIGRSARELLYEHPETFDAALSELLALDRWEGELLQRTRSGDDRLVRCRWTLVRDSDGEPRATLAINTDVTEHRQMEQQLLQAQRMESIGTLAGGVAHDINNVLTPILLATELLDEGETDPRRVELLDTIRSSAQRGSNLVQQVQLFARGTEGRRVEIDPDDAIAATVAILGEALPKNIDVVVGPKAASAHRIVCDPTQIQQVILNLCVNARDSMPDGGTITVSAEPIEIDEQYVSTMPEASVGTYILFRVGDTGTGIDPDTLERIFDPFFSTKEHGHGTGLGLSTSQAIVRSHGGFVRVHSEPGRGTTFEVYLPASGRTASPAPSAELPRGSGELVLVIDDDALVLDVTRRTLQAFDYRVVTAADGADGVSLFASRSREVDLVLTDMMMPIMDGSTTIRVLQRLRPEVPIIAASGLDASGRFSKATGVGEVHFLAKPYTARELLEVVRAALQPG